MLEAAGAMSVLALAVGVRVVKLGEIPRIVTADETDNLQMAYHIIAGTGPGFFGFDWKPAPIFSLYPLAWSIELFGDTISDFRLFPVILSLLTLMAFYLLARQSMRAPAALGAAALLATNLWFLHFSRTAWENINAPLFAVGACLGMTLAIRTRKPWWWAVTGVFVAFGLYGYFSARVLPVAVAFGVGLAIALKRVDWRYGLAGLALAGVVSAVLFAPMAKRIYDEWDYFNRRTDNVSVFNVEEPYEGDVDGWVIAAKNVRRNAEGFILMDGGEFGRGLWARYNPDGRAPLEPWMAPLLWAGMIVAVLRWRKTYLWWAFLPPLFIPQIFSKGTPDAARGIVLAPFLFLFIGMLFEELHRRVRTLTGAAVAVVGVTPLIVLAAVGDVREYFDWQQTPSVQGARMPGVDRCEWNVWQAMARAAAHSGTANLDPEQFLKRREEMACSPVAKVDSPSGERDARARTPELRDERRREDLQRIREGLEEFYRERGAFPDTGGGPQTLCTYRDLDVGCALEDVLEPVPSDPGDHGGYWYRSNGAEFTLYARLESTDGGCDDLPPGFFPDPDAIVCVRGSAAAVER